MANNDHAHSLSPPPSSPSPSPSPSPILVIPSILENKAKPGMEFPITSTFTIQEREDISKPIDIIVPAGMDIVNTIIDFARDHDVSILVNRASGAISEVNLYNILSPSDDLSFRGNLRMLTLSGFYTKCLSPLPPKNTPFSFFNIQFLRGMSPQIFGGLVRGRLVAAEPVKVMAFIINKHEYYQEVVDPITNSNVQPIMNTTHANTNVVIVSDDLNGITNNTINHPSFSDGASTSSPTNVHPPAAPPNPRDFNML